MPRTMSPLEKLQHIASCSNPLEVQYWIEIADARALLAAVKRRQRVEKAAAGAFRRDLCDFEILCQDCRSHVRGCSAETQALRAALRPSEEEPE